jgi:hypothetical protein
MTSIEETLAGAALKGATGPASRAASAWGARKWDKFRALYTNIFSEYVSTSVSKCSSVKNILYRNQHALTKEKYVSISFVSSNETPVSDAALVAALTHRRAVCLKGRGGAGKTMFTKWAVLQLFETVENHQLTPIFIELRELGDLRDLPFEEIVFKFVTNNRSKVNRNHFIEGLKAGLFVFVLDAADEIKKSDRQSICKKIEAFRRLYPETGILLTTREFPEIESISGFEHFSTRSLKKNEAIQIIQKLDYDDEVRDALIHQIKSDRTRRHDFFLENPLLVTILLLTFDQSKDIPTKRSAIYKRAFEALFERHDGSKGIYKRDHHAGLPLDEFESVFSTFCYGTYVNGLFDIAEGDLVKLFRQSCEISGIDEDPAKIALDAHESVCLLVKEGHDYVFCHRSFQEYFVAVFLRDYRGDDIDALYDAALSRGPGENVAEFAYEVDRKNFEKFYVLPGLRRILGSVERKMGEKEDKFRIFINHFFKEFQTIDGERIFGGFEVNNGRDFSFLTTISRIYPEASAFGLIVDFSAERPMVHDFPLEIARKSKAHRPVKFDNPRFKMSKFSLNEAANPWFAGTDFEKRSEKFYRDLKSLIAAIQKEHDASQSVVGAGKFSDFAKSSA